MAIVSGAVRETVARPQPRRARHEAEAPSRGFDLGGAIGHGSRLLLAGVVLLTVAGFGLLQVLQTSQVASTGYELRTLQATRAQLEAENRLLEARIAERSQLDLLRSAAVNDLGMVDPEGSLSISVPVAAPDAVPLPRRYVDEQPPLEASEPSLWERIVDRLPGFD
jgi:hypothetical protein